MKNKPQKNQSYYQKNKDKILAQQQAIRNAKYEGLIEGYDYIVCKECGFKSSELATHIINKHNMSVDEYKNKHKVATIKSQKSIDRLKGANNPAYQHGGKYSPFSDKFIKGITDIEETKKKAKQNKKILNKDTTKIDYWLEKTNGDESEAKKLLSERQSTFSLDKSIKKYGIEEGTEKWNKRQEKWKKTLDEKPLEEKQRINRLKLGNGYSVSKAEKELIEILKLYNFSPEHQFSLFNEENKKQYIYDIRIGNKIIEYNGDWWHCNPLIYNENYYHPRIKLFAKDIWKKDNLKIKYAEQNFEVFIIWETDYKNDKQGIIQKCLTFLMQ
jgi:hypothetical protein